MVKRLKIQQGIIFRLNIRKYDHILCLRIGGYTYDTLNLDCPFKQGRKCQTLYFRSCLHFHKLTLLGWTLEWWERKLPWEHEAYWKKLRFHVQTYQNDLPTLLQSPPPFPFALRFSRPLYISLPISFFYLRCSISTKFACRFWQHLLLGLCPHIRGRNLLWSDWEYHLPWRVVVWLQRANHCHLNDDSHIRSLPNFWPSRGAFFRLRKCLKVAF